MARKKHKTPKELDYLFERKTISYKQYHDFWEGYWGERGKRSRERFVDSFVSELQLELPSQKRTSGTITNSRKSAKQQAEEIGGYVIRCTKKGKPSKRGKFYRAIVRRKRVSGK